MDNSNDGNINDGNNNNIKICPSFLKMLPEIIQYLSEKDSQLAPLFQEVQPNWSQIVKPPYVALIGAIVGQRISYVRARKIRGNLYSHFGIQFNAADIELVSDSVLTNFGLSEKQITLIRRVNSYLERNDIQSYSVGEIRQLNQISGIGPWTIETTLLTSMLDLTVFPIGDLFIQKRIQKLYQLDHLPKKTEILKKCQLWSPYCGVVAWYLWRWFPLENMTN